MPWNGGFSNGLYLWENPHVNQVWCGAMLQILPQWAFPPGVCLCDKTTQTARGFLPWKILGKIASFHEIKSMLKAKHLLLRDDPTLPPNKSCWQGWLSRGQISSEAPVSPQPSFKRNSRFLIKGSFWLLLSTINGQDLWSCFWIITKIIVI